jgi:branched-chain amino acid transport system ATP-binding protein
MPDLLEIDDVSAGYEGRRPARCFAHGEGGASPACSARTARARPRWCARSSGLTARAGRILFDGIDITGLATHRIIAAGVACIPEGRKVFPKLTVEENLRAGAYREPSEAVVAERMADIFRIFPPLAERRHQLAGTMSGGEQAMVSIGRGLMRAPKLLLIDEPSLGLSPRLVRENFSIIRKINEPGITVFLVEQNVRQTLAIATWGYVLVKGRVVASGTPAELMEQEEVREAYFGRSGDAAVTAHHRD